MKTARAPHHGLISAAQEVGRRSNDQRLDERSQGGLVGTGLGSSLSEASQARTAWPGGSPDLVEYGRAAVSAFAYVSREQAREVHVMRLRSAFERAGFAHALRYVLAVLTLMREVQEVGSGYWFPTPTRVVRIGQGGLVIAATPTAELRRHLPVSSAGYARYVPSYSEGSLPEESFGGWLGTEIADSILWAREILRRAEADLGMTVDVDGLEFFSARRTTRRGREISVGGWTSDARKALRSPRGMILCRKRLAENYYRHFFGLVKGGRVREESAAPADLPRLQYGMAALGGTPLTVENARKGHTARFTIHWHLPRAERRLLTALARKSDGGWEKTYGLEVEDHCKVLASAFERLGAEIRDAATQ